MFVALPQAVGASWWNARFVAVVDGSGPVLLLAHTRRGHLLLSFVAGHISRLRIAFGNPSAALAPAQRGQMSGSRTLNSKPPFVPGLAYRTRISA
jgi:hypothetical protein